MARRRCLEFKECRTFIERGSRCAMHAGILKQLRNAGAVLAKHQVRREPMCAECGSTEDLTADHVIPLIESRSNDGEWQTLCRSCNARKGAR